MIKDMYNQLNPATLTGAIDVLVVEREDSELCASPFHVRFGKLGVLRAREKLVNITVNEEEVGLHMKLGEQGEAFFVVETDDDELPLRLLTSPLPSRPSSPFPDDRSENEASSVPKDDNTVKRKRRKRRKRRSITLTEAGAEHTESDSDGGSTDQNSPRFSIGEDSRSQPSLMIHPAEPSLSEGGEGDERTPSFQRLCNVFSDSELPQELDADLQRPSSPFSDSEAMAPKVEPVGWDWGELPGGDRGGEIEQKLSSANMILAETPQSMEMEQNGDSASAADLVSDGNNFKARKLSANTELSSTSSSPTKNTEGKRPVQGLYLDEILDLDPSIADFYIPQKSSEEPANRNEHADEAFDSTEDKKAKPSSVMSDAGVDSGTDCLVSDTPGDSEELPFFPMKMSLCGGKYDGGRLVVDAEKFNEKLVTHEQFLDDPVGVTNNPELVILVGDQYCDWETAGSLLLSVAVFRKPLSQETVERVINDQMSKKIRAASGSRLSWLWRRTSHRESTGSTYSDQDTSSTARSKPIEVPAGPPKIPLNKSFSASPTLSDEKLNLDSNNNGSSSCEDEALEFAPGRRKVKRAQTMQNLHPLRQCRSMKKTMRLSSDQLKSLNLKPGANPVTFSVTSQYQGTSRCYATIFLWKWSDKLVVSDIDGTITKSDVFGQILPVVGKDWTQGGVAQLYDNISKNGYKFIYLSARAIGQAGMTKGYLNWINQQGVSLPPGPMFLTPTSLMRAFHTEVIEKKPERFKIQCLHDIIALFPSDTQPLVAGFGNKPSDGVAYATVGIPRKRIFTINHRGQLKQEDLQTYTTSYSELGDIVDTFFPSLDSQQCKAFSDTREFSTFNYWRDDMPDISYDLMDF